MQSIIVDKCSTIMADAVKSLQETGKVQPALFFGKGDSLRRMELSIPDNQIEKILLTGEIKKLATEMGAEFIIFISDCWTSNQLETQPSLDPKKAEAIMMLCQFKDISFVTIQEYIRTDDYQIILGDLSTDSPNAGIFASLLPQKEQVESNA